MSEKVDFFNLTVQRMHGKPPEWRWCSLDMHDMPEDWVKIGGAVPVGVVERGKNKGRPKWPDQLETVHVRMKDIDESKQQYEAETGKCCECFGEGSSGSPSKTMFYERKPCKRCAGTGLSAQNACVEQQTMASP